MANPAPGFEQYPDYTVDIVPQTAEVVVSVDGTEIARSQRAVLLEESRHRPVWYLPLDDVDASLIEATDTDTYCPFKGHASYWSINTGALQVSDAIWAYLTPYDECAAIRGYASFYTNKVDLYIDGVLANKDGPGWTE